MGKEIKLYLLKVIIELIKEAQKKRRCVSTIMNFVIIQQLGQNNAGESCL